MTEVMGNGPLKDTLVATRTDVREVVVLNSDSVVQRQVPLGGRVIVKIYGSELIKGWSVMLMEVGVGVGGCGWPCVNADPGDS